MSEKIGWGIVGTGKIARVLAQALDQPRRTDDHQEVAPRFERGREAVSSSPEPAEARP
jgi:hypothetical protein